MSISKNKEEFDKIEEILTEFYVNAWRNHQQYEIGDEKVPMEGAEYWYDKSRLHDAFLNWSMKVELETGVKPRKEDYKIPNIFIDPNTGTQFRNI